jgi:hypothetical protein
VKKIGNNHDHLFKELNYKAEQKNGANSRVETIKERALYKLINSKACLNATVKYPESRGTFTVTFSMFFKYLKAYLA